MIRIKELRERKGINMMEAARLLRMPYTTYVNYEKGHREPTSEVLIQLADFFETSVDYIVGRSIFGADVFSQPNTISAPRLTSDEEDLIRKYRRLDERGKSAVRNVLEHEYTALPGDTPAARRQA